MSLKCPKNIEYLKKWVDCRLLFLIMLSCTYTVVHPVMIMEYLVYGDLLGYLRKSRGIHDKYHLGHGSVPEREIYDLVLFAKQIAAGMVFLGSRGVSKHLTKIKLQQNSTGWVHIWTDATSLTAWWLQCSMLMYCDFLSLYSLTSFLRYKVEG